jgi:hypothetical protein
MSYPIVTETTARSWYDQWCEASKAERPPRRIEWEDPVIATAEAGTERDWNAIAKEIVGALWNLLVESTVGDFERQAGILLHRELPDDPALCDADFWTWLATTHGRPLILERYAGPEQPPEDSDKFPANPLPDRNNFLGSRGRETLFFRLWIRAEMARDEGSEDAYLYARPGLIDFWRSHVFRQLFAHHKPFLKALVDFQFPDHRHGKPDQGRLKTLPIRELAKELSLACASVSVEALDETQAATMIERVYRTRVLPKVEAIS